MTLHKVIGDLEAARLLTQADYSAAYAAAEELFRGSLSLPQAQALPIWQGLALYMEDANEMVRVLFQDSEQEKGEDR